MKTSYKNKLLFISMFIVLIFTIYNIGDFYYTINKCCDSKPPVSSFSFWSYIRFYGAGQVLLFISTFIILIGSVYYFFQELNSGFFQNIITKYDYKKYMLKRILSCWGSSFFIFPLFSIIIFLIGSLLFTHNINTNELYFSDPMASFPQLWINNPLMYVGLITLLVYLYSIFVVNVGLIVSHYVDKFYLVLLATFLCLNAYNYALTVFIAEFFYSLTKNDFFQQFNIFAAYQPADAYNLWAPFTAMTFNIIISSVIVYLIYRPKEEVILNND